MQHDCIGDVSEDAASVDNSSSSSSNKRKNNNSLTLYSYANYVQQQQKQKLDTNDKRIYLCYLNEIEKAPHATLPGATCIHLHTFSKCCCSMPEVATAKVNNALMLLHTKYATISREKNMAKRMYAEATTVTSLRLNFKFSFELLSNFKPFWVFLTSTHIKGLYAL
ncbi:unnamed protein product [Ceratitis capitata]|uniref:(Mediterranean fruit fly) hypothetical protein n=1 Tax=Ceratitis capitata TaxID=7213 RepID=A0A811UQ61_CERCA|nr:unnamed protein product [Ceratitis capitata]